MCKKGSFDCCPVDDSMFGRAGNDVCFFSVINEEGNSSAESKFHPNSTANPLKTRLHMNSLLNFFEHGNSSINAVK